MLIKLFAFLKGYVKIKVFGFSPERFMNLCSNHDILLWNIENHCDYYIMCISIKGFFSLKPFLRKTKTKVVVLERYGLPFLMPKIIRRKIFLFGLLNCLVGMIILSNFIWAIAITGNTAITTDMMLSYLKKQNITYGMWKDKIDIEMLEENIRKDFSNVTWTSARITGTKLEIMIKENEHLTEEKEEKRGLSSDLVADKDGVVTGIVTRNGVPLVKIGSEVAKGDILVKGQIPILGEDGLVKSYQYCNADADIYIRCQYAYQDSISLSYEKNVFSGRKRTFPFVEVMGKNFTAAFRKIPYQQYDKVTNKKQLKLFDNFYLPVFYGDVVYREYTKTLLPRQKEEAKQLLEEEITKFVKSLEEKGVQIIEKNVKIGIIGQQLIATGNLVVIEQGGKSVLADVNGLEQKLAETQKPNEEEQ